MATTNKRLVLASRPSGEPSAQNFRLEEVPLPALNDGEVLVRHHYLSLDPYMRGRMNEGKSYAQPQPLDAVMIGGTVGEVVESRHAGYKAGDKVVGMGGWQQYSVVSGAQPGMLRKVDTSRVPLSAYLGAVGMPGVTAWVGLHKIIEAKAGETIVVSAASGAVGSVVGQLAKAAGCRAVGIAGGADKCAYVTRELGFDACIDYKATAPSGAASNDPPAGAQRWDAVREGLKQHCPQGVDVYFDNVGVPILDAVLARINRKARIVICGAIAQYNATGAMQGPKNYMSLLVNRARMEGMVVFDYAERYPQAIAELAGYLKDGRMKSREDVVRGGVRAFPSTLLKLFAGENFGKLVLHVAD